MSCVLRNDSWRPTSSAAAADAFSLAASPIEKQDESIARNTLPGPGKPGGNDRINRPIRDGPLFLIFPGISCQASIALSLLREEESTNRHAIVSNRKRFLFPI
jgi:hypothetical protein